MSIEHATPVDELASHRYAGRAEALIAEARQLDSRDELAGLRARFSQGEVKVAAGHSLGRPISSARGRVLSVFERVDGVNGEAPHEIHWGRDQTESDHYDYAFKLHLHAPSCATLSKLLGCSVQDVMLGNGLTDDLTRLVSSLFHPKIFGRRRRILCLRNDFNSDLTVIRTFMKRAIQNALICVDPEDLSGGALAQFKELDERFGPAASSEREQFDYIEEHLLLILEPETSDARQGLYSSQACVELITSRADEIAGALLPSVVFDTGQLLDISAINAALIDRGIIGIWDCAHSVGNVVHDFEGDRVVAAAGCGYKHLNGLPGGPGFMYQNATLLSELMAQHRHIRPTPISGWLSNGKTGPFDAFQYINTFSAATLHPETSVERYRGSNPEILALGVAIENLKIFEEGALSSIMDRKEALTQWLFKSLDALFEGEIQDKTLRYITPRAHHERGATICVSLAGVSAKRIEEILRFDELNLGVKFEIDVRVGKEGHPDTLRLTAHHCHMSFEDTTRLVLSLRQVYDHLRDS